MSVRGSLLSPYFQLLGVDISVNPPPLHYLSPHSLAFSVTLFCVEAAVAVIVLMMRRHPAIGGELGGPRIPKILTSFLLAFLLFFYVFMSTLESYGIIPSIASGPPTTAAPPLVTIAVPGITTE